MDNERSLIIYNGYHPRIGWVPRPIRDAGLSAGVAIVLSTYRSQSEEMVLDHRLWYACARAVTVMFQAGWTQVFTMTRPGFFHRLSGRWVEKDLGCLESYVDRLVHDEENTEEWTHVYWKKEERLVAAATCEPWHHTGGPDIFHDSYTTCFCVPPATVPALIETLRFTAGEAGGLAEDVVMT